MDEEYIVSLIEAQADESLNVEYKGALAWENSQDSMSWLQAKCIKAVLGFTNTEGGGLIILGVNDDGNGTRSFVGLSPEMLASYGNTEAIQECIDKYADGPLSYSIKKITYVNDGTEQTYMAIAVNEFDDTPVLCTRDFYIEKPNGEKDFILRKQDMYTRARKGRFGTIKATSLELRYILNLAHSKAEDRLLQLFGAVTNGALPNMQTKQSPYTEMDKDI
jgi:predicted HTH transcriptional regulator